MKEVLSRAMVFRVASAPSPTSIKNAAERSAGSSAKKIGWSYQLEMHEGFSAEGSISLLHAESSTRWRVPQEQNIGFNRLCFLKCLESKTDGVAAFLPGSGCWAEDAVNPTGKGKGQAVLQLALVIAVSMRLLPHSMFLSCVSRS